MRELTLACILELADRDEYLYLGSPYSKYPTGINNAHRAICLIAGELMRRRIRIWCPIAHSHPIAVASGLDPLDHKIWMHQDEAFERGAGGLIIAKMRTWEVSYGLGEEHKNFEAAGKPVWGLDPKLLGIIGA